MSLKILAVGDIHLGRRPTRLPSNGEAPLGERARELGPAEAWKRVVQTAVEEKVNAVLLAGDVVDQGLYYFEAYRELRAGVERLVSADIRILGVAGNHDVNVLPKLATQLQHFELLGGNGQWQKTELEAEGERLTLWGWSFPQEKVTTSPLEGVEFQTPQGPNLGLLHCDLDQRESPYAPVARRELEATNLDGWLLGHIHRPDKLSAPNPLGYLGSLTGLHPGETGTHGPWLISVQDGRIQEMEQWVLAPLRWEPLEVDISGILEAEEARERLLESLRKLDKKVAQAKQPPEAVGLRVDFTGRSSFGTAATKVLSEEDRAHIYHGTRETHYFIEQLENKVLPEIPLQELAKRSDPPGLLAQRLLLLNEPQENPERRKLLAEAQQKLAERSRKPQWERLQKPPPDEEQTAAWLHRSGIRLLEELLAQQAQQP